MIDQVVIFDYRRAETYTRLIRSILPDVHIIHSIDPEIGEWLAGQSDLITLLVLTDGLDVSELSGGFASERYCVTDKARDRNELHLVRTVDFFSTRFLGFGRGSHLLWAEFGDGEIFYKTEGHFHPHMCRDSETGEMAVVNSMHQRMVYAQTGAPPTVCATAYLPCSVEYFNESTKLLEHSKRTDLTEMWAYTNILGVQYRPDLVSCPVSGRRLFYKYLAKALLEG